MMVMITDADIIQLFMGGLSLKQLIDKVASNERLTKSAARFKVEHAIYGYMKNAMNFKGER